MSGHNLLLAYAILVVASLLFQWPAGILTLFIICHVNGEFKEQ